MTMARFRAGGFIRLSNDYEDNEYHRPRKGAYY
jgi:hypothetical protein